MSDQLAKRRTRLTGSLKIDYIRHARFLTCRTRPTDAYEQISRADCSRRFAPDRSVDVIWSPETCIETICG